MGQGPPESARPWVIAVVGGVGSGKSTVARELESLGAMRLDADRLAHEALDEPDVRRALVTRYGHEILGPDARVDRKKLARLIFGSSPAAQAERAFVEGIIHPRVQQRILEELGRAGEEGKPAVVLDVPLLLEVGWEDLADDIIFVEAPPEVRAARAAARGWSRSEWLRREAAQLPADAKARVATVFIPNSGSLADLRGRVARWWKEKSAEKGFRMSSK